MITKNTIIKNYIFLHASLLLYSGSGFFSKTASKQDFLSFDFFLFYGCVLFIMVVYAFLWQQILKRIPLTTAFANKAITILWGMLFGFVFFKETITVNMIIGAIIICAGIVLVVKADE